MTANTVILASVIDGDIALADGMIYRLTPCCKASGKGGAGSATGVCCRACYRDVPEMFGWAALVGEARGEVELAEQLAPTLERFAGDLAARVFATARA